MKISNINGKKDSSGLHNDRNFDLELAPHINREKINENQYYVYNGEYNGSLRDVEVDFYKNVYGDYIKAQNKRNESYGKSKRNKTVEDYYHSYRTRPEDKILQIGNKDEHIDGETLWKCALEYAEKFNELYGDHCKIIDMALHMDEATPHVHVRRAWMAEDKDGNVIASQRQALEQLGFVEPDMANPVNKRNNATVTFTRVDAALFEEVCKDHNIEFEQNSHITAEHLSTLEYKKKKISEEIEELERRRDNINEEIEDEAQKIIDEMEEVFKEMPFIFDNFEHELMHIEEKKAREKLKLLLSIYKRALSSLRRELDESENKEYIEKTMKEKSNLRVLNTMKSYIKDKGLAADFMDYANKTENVEK